MNAPSITFALAHATLLTIAGAMLMIIAAAVAEGRICIREG